MEFLVLVAIPIQTWPKKVNDKVCEANLKMNIDLAGGSERQLDDRFERCGNRTNEAHLSAVRQMRQDARAHMWPECRRGHLCARSGVADGDRWSNVLRQFVVAFHWPNCANHLLNELHFLLHFQVPKGILEDSLVINITGQVHSHIRGAF